MERAVTRTLSISFIQFRGAELPDWRIWGGNAVSPFVFAKRLILMVHAIARNANQPLGQGDLSQRKPLDSI